MIASCDLHNICASGKIRMQWIDSKWGERGDKEGRERGKKFLKEK